ncbi:MAG TPA: alpha/beta hydrolase [Pseudogracilibacillus sp.]|nr:alpha/beta hydrolase [Pseudogracilibacillus sp.]
MWEKTFVETTRGKFEVFVSGSGEPLCVTHLYSEFNEQGNIFANPFTPHYKVYLVNLRGCGNSVHVEDTNQYSMEESVKDLESIRVALGYNTWGFAGHSTGGMLALKYSIVAPNSLTKIIAGCTSASKEYSVDADSIYSPMNSKFKRIIEIMTKIDDPSIPVETQKELGYEWDLMSYYSEDKLKEALKIPNSGKTVGPRLEYFVNIENPTYDLRNDLVNVKVPSHIYAGKYDAQCPYKYGEEIASLIPNASFTAFNESNHNPYVEEEEKFKRFVKSTL